MKERTAAYIRVSTQEQKMHGLSLDAQERKLEDYAESHGLEIVGWYRDEGVSGRKLISKRPELQRMIADAQTGAFRRIIFIKLDRFFRSVGEYYKCMEMLGDIPWTATEEQYDLTTANGKMLINMKLTIAQLEADQTGERIKMVNEYKAKQGLAVSPTRCMPFCFARDGRKVVKRNEAIMQDLIDHVTTYHSVRGAMDYVNRKHGTNLLYRSVRAVLANPMICGEYRGNPNYCEPYVSKEEFEEIQRCIGWRTRTPKSVAYIFNGLIRCPECGHALNGTQHRTTVNGNTYSYSVYRCPSHRRDKSCSFKTIVFESHIERLMIAEVDSLFSGAEIAVKAGSTPRRKTDTTKLKAELERVNYAWEKGRLSPEEYDTKYDTIVAKIKQAEADNAAIDAQPRIMQELTGDWKALYNDLSNAGKAAWWKSFVESISIHWESGKYAKKRIDSVEFK